MTLLLVRRSISTGSVLGGLAALFAIIIVLAIQQVRTDVATLHLIRQTRAVLGDVSELKLELLGAETGQRGFLLTGKEDYLAPYRSAQLRLRPVENELTRLFHGNPAQRDLLGRLFPMIDQKMAEMESTLQARRVAGPEAALKIVASDSGHHLMRRCLGLLDRLQAEEDRFIVGRRVEFDRERMVLACLAGGGAILALLCILIGGLALRRASRRTREGEERYRLLAQNTSDMIERLDLDLRCTYVSPSSLLVCGYKPAELLGRNALGLAHPDDVSSMEHQFGRLASGRSDTELLTFRLRHKDGQIIWVEAALNLVRDAATQAPRSIIASLRDISSRKTQSDELRVGNLELERLARHLAKARDRAEQASSAKTRFLAGMSHELRTPLNGIIGYAHLLRLEGGLTDAQEARVSNMLAASEHLLGMINHVLDLSEIECEHVDLQTSHIDLPRTAQACLALVEPAGDRKRLQFRLIVHPASPRSIVTDAARLRQVLLNLLGNAVKFTDAGSVELRLLPASDAQAVRIEVADTGPGIPVQQRHRLFGEFERLHIGQGAVEGAGLGLAISGRLASLLGGRIGHEDNQGGGSLFWLEIPLGNTSEPSCAGVEPTSHGKRRLRILIADDVAMNRDIAQAFLRAAGHETVAVADGLAAIEAAEAGGFDAVLMDVRMPGIDGLEAARRIRALPPPASAVPIVALTAQAFSEQVDECLAAGMNGHLSKPFAPETLFLAIERAVAMDPSALADMSAQDAYTTGLPLFDRIAFDYTACFLQPGAINPYVQIIGERGGSLLASLRAMGADCVSLAGSAHEYAGSAGMFGFLRSAELARRYERAVQTASPDAARIGRQLTDAIAATLPEISRLLEDPESVMEPAGCSEGGRVQR